MKIACLMYMPLKKMGGAQVFMINLLSEVVAQGHEVDLYVSDTSYREIQESGFELPFKVYPVLWKTYRLSMVFPWVVGFLLRRIQKKKKYDLWQILGAYPAGVAAAGLHGKVTLVLRSHGEDVQKLSRWNYGFCLNPKVERKVAQALSKMDGLIAISENIQECFVRLQQPVSKIRVIANAVQRHRFQLPFDRDLFRKGLGIGKDEVLLVTFGRFHFKKGFDLIPNIAYGLRQQKVSFRWLLIGAGHEWIHGEVAGLELQDYFIFKEGSALGKNHFAELPNEQVIQYLRAGDIFVFPTRIEGLGNVILEAMAAGLAIVTTRSPGVREVVEHEKTALLSEVDDVKVMVANIQKLIVDADLRQRLRRNSLDEAEKYEMQKAVTAYLNFYEALLKQPKSFSS